MTTDQMQMLMLLLISIDAGLIVLVWIQHRINTALHKVSDLNAAVIAAIITDLEQVREASGLPASKAVDRVLTEWQKKERKL